ncbi:MAG: BREX system ATP-binding domain-containing protein [Candidatus Binatia bacterium]
MYMRPAEWFTMTQQEYLHTFIRNGGAAVKFLIPTEDINHNGLKQGLRSIAEAERYQFVSVDAATTRVHMVDHLFHEIARQIDWDALSFAFVSQLLTEHGFTLPTQRYDFTLQRLAELNQRDVRLLQQELLALPEKRLLQDYQMCQEFRLAMIRLCQSHFGANSLNPVPAEVIKEWLCGQLRRLAELKPALIFQKVARDNARYLLSSLSHWLHLAGKSGLVLGLDISRCLVQRPRAKEQQDESRYYTAAMTLDAYEVLRQWIDATDDLEFCFIAVIAPPAFLHPDDRRGVYSYDALRMRIWDEIRDRQRINPFSTLIRLSPCPESTGISSQESMR